MISGDFTSNRKRLSGQLKRLICNKICRIGRNWMMENVISFLMSWPFLRHPMVSWMKTWRIISALRNLNFKDSVRQNSSKLPYITVSFFGLIHGLGFSNYLQSLLGKESSIFTPLLAFNLGLECGQLIVVAIILFITTALMSFTRFKRIHMVYVISGIIIGLVLPMFVERIP